MCVVRALHIERFVLPVDNSARPVPVPVLHPREMLALSPLTTTQIVVQNS